MDIHALTPRTLSGIKRAATRMKRALGISHAEALDRVARQAGYRSYRDAQRMLPTGDLRPVRLTGHFKMSDGSRNAISTTVRLRTPLNEMIVPSDDLALTVMKAIIVQPDGSAALMCGQVLAGSVMTQLSQAARRLQFMDATGLRPSAFGDFPEGLLPHWDHVAYWKDSLTGTIVMTDEPYRNADMEGVRQIAASALGYDLSHADWGGLHLHSGCDIITRGGTTLASSEIAAALAHADPAFRSDRAKWTYHSEALDPASSVLREGLALNAREAAHQQSRIPDDEMPIDAHVTFAMTMAEIHAALPKHSSSALAASGLKYLVEDWAYAAADRAGRSAPHAVAKARSQLSEDIMHRRDAGADLSGETAARIDAIVALLNAHVRPCSALDMAMAHVAEIRTACAAPA